MKQFVLIIPILLTTVFGHNIETIKNDNPSIEPFIFEDLINSTIESLRPDIPDPLTIDDLNLDFPNDAVITGNASISNFRLTGLRDFHITYLHFALIGLTLNFNVSFPAVSLYTDYALNLGVSSIPVYGNGNISGALEDFEIDATGQANLTDGIQVDNIKVQISLGNASFALHGLYNDEELSSLISNILNDLVVKLVDENPDLVTSIVSPIVEAVINAILGAVIPPITTEPPTEITAEMFKINQFYHSVP